MELLFKATTAADVEMPISMVALSGSANDFVNRAAADHPVTRVKDG
jgi:hypothetical protein